MAETNPVEEYLKLAKEAKKHIDTITFNLREAYNKGEESTIGADDLVNLESLAEQSPRDSFKQSFFDSLNPKVFNYFGATANDIFRQDALWEAYAGFTRTTFNMLVENAKNKMSYDGFMGSIEESLKRVFGRISSSPMSVLRAEDGPAVAAYIKSKQAERTAAIDGSKLGIPDMAKMLNQYI